MSEGKHTAVLGASENPTRYAYLAANRLHEANHPISLVSIKKGELFGIPFQDIRDEPKVEELDTITLYIGARHLDQWFDYILRLKPKRIIFNPGTEHDGLAQEAEKKGIEVVYACTLVMLSTGQF